MKLSSRYDIEAPIADVFAELVNIDQWERAAMRRGAEVTRTDRLSTGSQNALAGMTWNTRFAWRGKDRRAVLRIERLEPPQKLDLALTSSVVDLATAIDLMELSLRRTRLALTVDLQPKTLTAKVYVQSLRLAKGRVERSFQTRISQFVLELEDRIRRR